MQTAETDNLNKNAVDYSQHIIILTELAVFEHWHVFRSSEARATQCQTLDWVFVWAFCSWHVEQICRVLTSDWKTATDHKKSQNWQQHFIDRDVFMISRKCFSLTENVFCDWDSYFSHVMIISCDSDCQDSVCS